MRENVSAMAMILVMCSAPVAPAADISRAGTTVTASPNGSISIRDSRLGIWLQNGWFLGIKGKRPIRLTAAAASGRLVLMPSDKALPMLTVGIEGDGSVHVRTESGAGGCRFEADALWGTNPLLCRLAPPAGARTAFFSSGPAPNLAANALFDIDSDRAVAIEGRGFWKPVGRERFRLSAGLTEANPLVLRLKSDHYRKGWGIRYYKPLDRSVFNAPISGWCSWYGYQWHFNENDLVSITDWIAANLKQFGCEYVQIDSCFLDEGAWTEWNSRFPHGGKWAADYIHSKGLKAGLWLTPYSTREDDLVKEHPDWFLWKDGKTVPTFVGRHTIDCTNPDVIERWLKPLYRTLALDWGYDMFKHDGQPEVMEAYRNSRFFKEGADPEEAYRTGQEAIREAIGKSRFILSCWGCTTEGIGIIDGSRTGGDTNTHWDGIKQTCNATRKWVYLNNIAMYTDPDVVCVREPLTLDQARLWASLVALTGQVTLATDDLTALPQERVDILRRIFPVCPTVPSDLYCLLDEQMDIIDVKFARSFGEWDIIGLFNYTSREKPVHVAFTELGLPRGSYLVYDFWNKRYLGRITDAIDLELEAASCRVLSVHRTKNVPQVISTSRHVTQGGVDLKDVKWNNTRLILSGVSSVVGEDPYEIRIALPTAPHTYTPTGCKAEGAEAGITTGDGMAFLILRTRENRDVRWSVWFRKAGPDAKHPPQPERLRAKPVPSGGITLSWPAIRDNVGVAHYLVYRDGTQFARTYTSTYLDLKVVPGRHYVYSVQAVDHAGLRSKPSCSVRVATAPVSSYYLCDLQPLSAVQDYGVLRPDRSTENQELTIAGRKYPHGLGCHASSEIRYYLGQGFARFSAEIGVDSEVGQHGSVVFRILGNDKLLYDSGDVRGGEPARRISVDVSHVDVLTLVVADAGDGIGWDHADWADAMLVAK